MNSIESPSASFKIVRINEGKDRSLALVPASWESRGVLYWPKLKNDNKLNKFIKNLVAPGTPPEVKWINNAAKVVEANIISYAAGNARLEILLNENVTLSTTAVENIVPNKGCRTTRANESEKNYSSMFSKHTQLNERTTTGQNDFLSVQTKEVYDCEDLLEINEDTVSAHTIANAPDNQMFVLCESQQILREQMCGDTAQHVLGKNNQISGIKNPLEYIETAAEEKQEQSASTLSTVNVLTDEVHKILAELGETTKKVDEIYGVIIKGGTNPSVVVNQRNDQKIKFKFEPIDTVDTAVMFENILENNEYEEELMAHFTEDRARSSHLKENNVAFNLVDKVFTRAFFDDVSWTGIAKKSCRKKECFSQFVRIRKFFFNLCHSVDKNYSMAMCDEWFKNVAIRTSGARMQVKGTRASRTKNRKRSDRTNAPIKTNGAESYEDDQVEPKMVKMFVPTDDEQDPNYSFSNENLD